MYGSDDEGSEEGMENGDDSEYDEMEGVDDDDDENSEEGDDDDDEGENDSDYDGDDGEPQPKRKKRGPVGRNIYKEFNVEELAEKWKKKQDVRTKQNRRA